MQNLTTQMDAIRSRIPWTNFDRRTKECAKLWGITDSNRADFISDSGVFLHSTIEKYAFGSCKAELRIAQAPNGQYATATSYQLNYCGGGSLPSVHNSQAYEDYHTARIGGLAQLEQRITSGMRGESQAACRDAQSMLCFLRNEQQPTLL